MQPVPEEAHLWQVQDLWIGLAHLHEGLQLCNLSRVHTALSRPALSALHVGKTSEEKTQTY